MRSLGRGKGEESICCLQMSMKASFLIAQSRQALLITRDSRDEAHEFPLIAPS